MRSLAFALVFLLSACSPLDIAGLALQGVQIIADFDGESNEEEE